MSGAACYYPNGNPSTGDIPCGDGDGVACCPQGWSCEPNGLCHLASPFYYGRYTCTDKSWKSKGCPNICTKGNTAAGAEAIIECSSGQYCCDANRPDALPDGSIDSSRDCCHTSNDRFPLAQLPLAPGGSDDNSGSAASSSSTTPTSSSSTSTPSPSSTSTTSTSTSSSPSTSTTSSSSSTSATPSSNNASPTTRSTTSSRNAASSSSKAGPTTSIITSVITSDTGGSTTLITTTSSAGSALPASQSSSPTQAPSSGSKNLGSIIGPAVAVPVAVLLLAAIAFLLFRRRRRHNQTRASSPPPMRGDNLQPMYGDDAKGLVDSPYTGKSELEGSPSIVAPGTPGNGNMDGYHTPNDVGVGKIRKPKSELAASNSTMRSPKSRLSEMYGSPTMGETPEARGQPAELPGNEPQGNLYKPYRPPGLGLTQ